MRDQLHLMELVDNYLDGAMSNQDRSAFEERMRNNEELRALVEDQQRLRRAARRSPARAAVKKAYGNYRWGKWAPGLGASAIVTIAVTASFFLWKSRNDKTGSDGAPITNEEHRLLTDTTGTRLEPLVFTIDPTKDTTLVTPSGIVLDVPRGAFTDSAGKPLTSPVRVTLLEALDPLDIMRAGLSTMSGDTLLETGGMFYFDAQANGSAVKIDPAKSLTAMVPAAQSGSKPGAATLVPEARVRHILFSTQGKSGEERAQVKVLAERVLSEVKRDKSKFGAMVAKYSEDPGSKVSGGVYEWFDKAQMVPEFTAASFDEPVGAMTLCETSYGFHIVEVLGQRDRTFTVPSSATGEMQLYQGVKRADGVIDWRNPRPLTKSLIPVDITTLNFYPPDYETKLAELGQDVTNKAFKDSLYFSFAGSGGMPLQSLISEVQFALADTTWDEFSYGQMLFLTRCGACHKTNTDMTAPALRGSFDRWRGKGDIYEYIRDSQAMINAGNEYARELFERWKGSVMTPQDLTNAEIDAIFKYVERSGGAQEGKSGIDPAKVKAIWTDRFNNTNIATREFEERMRAIHRTCGNEVLEMYVTGLDKDLAEVDAAVGGMGYPEFDHFAERNDGRVQLPAHAADRLRTFYENQSRAESAAIRKTQEKFWREQRKADRKSAAKQADHAMAENVREGQLFEREFEANLGTVYKQLGYQRVRLPRSAWVVPVVATGWWNVDKAVLAATTNRARMSYTDDKTGKTATLTYTPLAVEVTDRASFDELFVYLLPKQLNSYQRMKEDGGIFSERLNSIFAYDLFCLGMKGKQQFAFITSINGQGEVTASLQPVDENALRQMLKSKGRVEDQLLDEARYLDWLVVDKQRRQANIAREELRNALLPVVFPCADSDASKEAPRSTKVTVDSGPVVYWSGATLDERAEFPGGLNALQRFLTTSVVYPPDARAQGVGGRVLVGFRIDRSGKVVDIKIERSVNEQLDAEAMRVVGLMPKWKPAAVNGQPVDIAMSLPILFEAL